jgi:hypothetical protein
MRNWSFERFSSLVKTVVCEEATIKVSNYDFTHDNKSSEGLSPAVQDEGQKSKEL